LELEQVRGEEAQPQQQASWEEAPQQAGWEEAPQQAGWEEAPQQAGWEEAQPQQAGWEEAQPQQAGWEEAQPQQAGWEEAQPQQGDAASAAAAAELGGTAQPVAVSWAPSVFMHTVFWRSLVAAATPQVIAEAERAYLAVLLSRATPEAHALAVEQQQQAEQAEQRQVEAPLVASLWDDLDLSLCDGLLADHDLLATDSDLLSL
jgi:hypothetical protein